MFMLSTILCMSAFWVYLDATKNKIGKLNKKNKFLAYSYSAGLWSFWAFMLWIVVFPAYLFKRKKLIQVAQQNPVVSKYRTVGITLWLMLITFFLSIEITPHVINLANKKAVATLNDKAFQAVKNYHYNILNDFNSVEYIALEVLDSSENLYSVECRYRAKNALGAYVLNDDIYYLTKGFEVNGYETMESLMRNK